MRNSQKKNDRQSLTFIEGNKVQRLHRDGSEATAQIDTLMVLSLNATETATDLWVHDGLIAVRINDNKFKFFIEPLVASTPVEALAFEPSPVDASKTA